MTEKFTEERYRQIVDEATEHDKVISDGVYIEAAIRNPLTREYAYADYVDHDVSVLVEDLQEWATVLQRMFSNNFKWRNGEIGFHTEYFNDGARVLEISNSYILWSRYPDDYDTVTASEYLKSSHLK